MTDFRRTSRKVQISTKNHPAYGIKYPGLPSLIGTSIANRNAIKRRAISVNIFYDNPFPDSGSDSDDDDLIGTVVDGYIKNGTVKILDINENELYNTTTDDFGEYTVIGPLVLPGVIIVEVTEGIDIATGKKNKLTLRNIVSIDENSSFTEVNVTLLSTIKERIVRENIGSTTNIETIISNANTKVADTFGIDEVDIDNDFIDDNDFNIVKKNEEIKVLLDSLKNVVNEGGFDQNNALEAVSFYVDETDSSLNLTLSSDIQGVIGELSGVTIGVSNEANMINYVVETNTLLADLSLSPGNDFDAVFTEAMKITVASNDKINENNFNDEVAPPSQQEINDISIKI